MPVKTSAAKSTTASNLEHFADLTIVRRKSASGPGPDQKAGRIDFVPDTSLSETNSMLSS
jgi:hypothetical protein